MQNEANTAVFEKYFGHIRTANFAIAEVNRIIARLDDQQYVFYMDIGARFLDEKGFFLPDAFRPDNLHPQAKGYEIWGEAVRPTLAEWLQP